MIQIPCQSRDQRVKLSTNSLHYRSNGLKPTPPRKPRPTSHCKTAYLDFMSGEKILIICCL